MLQSKFPKRSYILDNKLNEKLAILDQQERKIVFEKLIQYLLIEFLYIKLFLKYPILPLLYNHIVWSENLHNTFLCTEENLFPLFLSIIKLGSSLSNNLRYIYSILRIVVNNKSFCISTFKRSIPNNF